LDPAYIPLLAAGISGGCTLLGVGIGALVLRFNQRSQVNAFALEFYKRQLDGLAELWAASHQLERCADRYLDDPTEERRRVVIKASRRLHHRYHDNGPWLPPSVIEAITKVYKATGPVLRMLYQGKVERDLVKEKALFAALTDFRTACGAALHQFYMSEAVRQHARRVPLTLPPELE
jgi:hypothetical protein